MRRKWLLALGSLLFSLLVLEGIARARWTAPWYERLRIEQEQNQKLTYSLNRWKLRDQDYPSPKPEGRRRILVLGDSFTFGLGVKDDDRLFCSLLEQQLDQEARQTGQGGVDVLNGGIAGSRPRHWVRLWNEVASDFDPDVLLIVFFLRDGTEIGLEGTYFDQIRRHVTEGSHRRWAYRCCYLYRMYQDIQDRKWIGKNYEETLHQAYFGEGPQSEPWRLARRNLKQLRDHADERGIPVGLVVFPVLAELAPGSYPFLEEVKTIRRFGKSNGFETLSLLPAFLGHDASELWVSPGDQHPNERGHQIAAEALLPFVNSLLDQS